MLYDVEQASKRFAVREEALRRHEETERRLAALRKDEQRAATIIQVDTLLSAAVAMADDHVVAG